MARENSGWGYDRIAGALTNLGPEVSAQTVGNVLKRHGLAPAPKRSQNTTWSEFIAAHYGGLGSTQRPMVVWSTDKPRSAISSSTSRRLRRACNTIERR
jgi:hypothetical protein